MTRNMLIFKFSQICNEYGAKILPAMPIARVNPTPYPLIQVGNNSKNIFIKENYVKYVLLNEIYYQMID